MTDEGIFKELVCTLCGAPYAAYRPSRNAVENPVCPHCRRHEDKNEVEALEAKEEKPHGGS